MTDGPEFLTPRRRVDGPITLAQPDPGWQEAYCHAEERIRAALGPRALRVEHVGSTSVPGLAAKPFIDIVLAVADSADEAAYVPDLESAGYQLRVREPSWHEHHWACIQDYADARSAVVEQLIAAARSETPSPGGGG